MYLKRCLIRCLICVSSTYKHIKSYIEHLSKMFTSWMKHGQCVLYACTFKLNFRLFYTTRIEFSCDRLSVIHPKEYIHIVIKTSHLTLIISMARWLPLEKIQANNLMAFFTLAHSVLRLLSCPASCACPSVCPSVPTSLQFYSPRYLTDLWIFYTVIIRKKSMNPVWDPCGIFLWFCGTLKFC